MGDIRIDPGKVRGAAADTEALSRQVAKRLDHSLDGADAVYGAHYGNGWGAQNIRIVRSHPDWY